MIILFDVQSSIIRRLDENVIAAGSTVIAEFSFTSDWYGQPTRTAVFVNNGQKYYVNLDVNNRCVIPPQCLTNDTQSFTVSVFSDSLTTIEAVVYVCKSSGAGDDDGYVPTFIYEQGIASDNWYIVHNLNKYPSVTVVDSAGNEIICSVQYVDLNICICTFNAPFKGKAYLN